MKRKDVMKKILSVALLTAMTVNLASAVEPAGQVQAAETGKVVYSQDFETGATLDRNGADGTGSITNQMEIEKNWYLKLAGFKNSKVQTPGITVETEKRYTLSYRVKVSAVDGNICFYPWILEWDGKDGYKQDTTEGLGKCSVKQNTDGWVTYEMSYTPTEGMNHVYFVFEEAGWGGSADACLDDITLKEDGGEIVYSENFNKTEALTPRESTPTQSREQEELPEYYLEIANVSGGYIVKTPGIAVEAEQYTLSYRVNMSNVKDSFYFYPTMQEWDDNGNYAYNADIAPAECRLQQDTDGWVTLEMPYTPTEGKNHVQFFFEDANWGGSADICLDDIVLKKVSTGEVAYSEDFSTQKNLDVHSAGSGGSQSFVQDGNHYLELTNVGGGYKVITPGIAVEAEKNYILSYRVNMSNVNGSVCFYPWTQEWDDNDNYSFNTEIAPSDCKITAATDGWVTLEIPYTPAEGKNHVQFFFESADWGGSADICLDDIVVYEQQQEHQHKGTYVKGTAVTCTTAGVKAHYHCDGCGKDFEDEACTQELTSLEIAALGHKGATYQKGTAATCTTAGVKAHYHCESCGKNFEDKACTKELTSLEIKANGHKMTKTDAKKATCTATGNNGYYYCSGCKKYYKDKAGTKETTKAKETIAKKAHTYKTTVVKAATTSKNGQTVEKCSCGDVKKNSTKTIYKASQVKLDKTVLSYTGNAQQPKLTVKDSRGKTISSNYYTATWEKGRKNVGTYKVTVKFKGNYSGSKTLSFKINPKKISIKKPAAAKKAFTVTWSKQKQSLVDGYQVWYSTDKNMKKAVIKKDVKNKNGKVASYKASKLNGNKKYYVKVRSYKRVGKTTYYSDWSSVQNVKTK